MKFVIEQLDKTSFSVRLEDKNKQTVMKSFVVDSLGKAEAIVKQAKKATRYTPVERRLMET